MKRSPPSSSRGWCALNATLSEEAPTLPKHLRAIKRLTPAGQQLLVARGAGVETGLDDLRFVLPSESLGLLSREVFPVVVEDVSGLQVDEDHFDLLRDAAYLRIETPLGDDVLQLTADEEVELVTLDCVFEPHAQKTPRGSRI